MVSLSKLLSNIRLPWLLFTLLVFGALVKLGLWQNDRAGEKERRLANIEILSQQAALSVDKVLSFPANDINDIPINLSGTFEKDVLFLLDNQTNKGRLGYRAYQVLNTSDHSVLVNLGWVQGSIDRQKLPDINPIEGQFELNGHVRLMEKGIVLMEQRFDFISWPLRVQQIELDKFSTITTLSLLPFVVYLDENEQVGYEKNWQPIVMPPEKHRAYAFQWFSLAIAWILLMFWASIKFSKQNN
jgi:cytochrome oxidase assembly protein ShyY1